MRRLAGLAAVLASGLACAQQADRNPYALRLDPAPYVLAPAYRAAESASAGASRLPAPVPLQPAARALPAPDRALAHSAAHSAELRERQHEYEIRTLQEERDAWRRRAERLDLERLEAQRLGLRRY
jgi:hypothetical protein